MSQFPVFSGGVFHASIPGGRAGAELFLRGDGIVARLASGEELVLPYAACQLELGGASGRMLFLRSPDRSLTFFSEAPELRPALLALSHPALSAELHQLEGRQRAARGAAQRGWWGLLLALLVAAVGGYFGMRAIGRSAVRVLPHSVDEKIGELAVSSMNLGGPVVTDAQVKDPVAAIVKRLTRHAKPGFQFEVRVVDAPIVNAFALPGGQIVVYTGLLRAAAGPEQVAGVLAHEMAHVTERHGLERISQSLGVVAAVQLLFGDLTGIAALVVELFKEGALLSYGRDQESAADREGVRILDQAKIDPRALAAFFRLLEREHGKGVPGLGWLSTHPELADRIREVERQAKALGSHKYETISVDWGTLKRRVGATSEASEPAVTP